MVVSIQQLSQLASIPEVLSGYLQFQDMLVGMIDRERSYNVYQNLSLYAGNNKTYVIYIRDRELNPIDLTGAVCIFTLKEQKADTVPKFQKHTNVAGEGQIGAANKGEAYFYILPVDTATLNIEQYVYDVKAQVSGKTYTVLEGNLNLLKPVNL